jgi:DNA-binding LacI/PurR family transcriptional regulator
MEPSAACLAKLREIPHVWFMTRRSATFPGDYVEPNNEENGRLAADYLFNKGHKAVAVISTDPNYSAIVRRVRAFIERAGELKLPVHSILGKSNPGVSYLEIEPVHGESATLVRNLLSSTPSGYRPLSAGRPFLRIVLPCAPGGGPAGRPRLRSSAWQLQSARLPQP